ncbi:MAG: ABC transporter permease, partial [Gemmatimonadota bacterium]
MIRPGIRRLLRLPIRGRGSLAAEVEEEIRLHLSLRAEAMMRSGMPPEQAHAEALRRFGDLEEGRRQMRRTATRRARTMNGREWLATLWQDVRYGARQLRRNPGFTATAVLALGLGIGANTAIFSFVDALMLRPPAHVAAPDELVRIYTSGFSGELYGGSSYPDFLDFRSRLRGSADLAAFAGSTMTLDAGEQVESVPAEFVTTNYFSVLGIDPAAGRLMLPAGSRVEGDDAVAVISHSLWQRAFGGDAGVAGRVVRLNGSPLTIVGVAPQGFAGPGGRSPADAWIPIGQAPALRPSSSGGDILEQRSSRWLGIMGRPLSGVRPEAVAARVESIGAALYEQYPDEWSDVREVSRQVSTIAGRSTWLSPAAHGAITNFAALLMALVGLVLLIACANVANLLLARATKRRQELAVRLAIGAERGRIVRQLTTESCLLAAAAGIVGVVLALGTMGVLNGVGEALPFGGSVEVSLDGRVLVFAVAISLIAATLFGLLPALITARRDPAPVLRNEGANAGRGSGALRAGLVTGQVAICVVLLVCASLLVRSLRNAVDTELGFQPSGVLLVPLTAMPPQYTEA